ncbi:hypothetical protein ACH5RR_029364 [Cinchona calisaya]|uniref:Reverse transcriptase Ty1/copia-type domain-containing protein n=1 Tax=Cinchona calisaya TaxID=153742 RepID=A0ABD2YSM2_9GENT
MKDMSAASYVVGTEIHRDRVKKLLSLSQKAYINKVLERFGMKNCSSIEAPIVKGEKLNLDQCSKNALEPEQVKNIPYTSLVGRGVNGSGYRVVSGVIHFLSCSCYVVSCGVHFLSYQVHV